MISLFNDDIPLAAWRKFLIHNPHATPFQAPEFYKLFNSGGHYSAQAIAISDSESVKALAVITIQKEPGFREFFSRRGIIYGGPLIDKDCPEALGLLLHQISQKLRKVVIYLEIRNFSDFKDYNNIYTRRGWSYIPYYNVQVNLLGHNKESLKLLFNYNRRREIKQSLIQGASYITCTNDEQVNNVYKILLRNYKERVNLPLPGVEFFLNYFHTQSMKIFAVIHNDMIIGGAFCPVLEKEKLFTFYYCGLREYHKKIFPTHLAILASMEYCIDHKIPHFNFMGAGKPDVDYGVRNYKLEFGGELVQYGRFIKINSQFLYQMGRFGISVIKRFKI